MAFRRLKSILSLAVLLVLLFTASVLLLHSLIQKPSVQDYLMQRLSEAVGYEIHASRIRLILWKGIGIQAREFEVKSADGVQRVAASGIRINFSVPELIRGNIVPVELALVEPRLTVSVPDDWRPPLPDSTVDSGETPLKMLTAFPSVTLERARIVLKGTPFLAKGVSLRLSRRSDDPATFDGALNGKIDYKGDEIALSGTGSITWNVASGPSGRVELKAHGIPLAHIQLPDLPVKTGTADLEATASGSLTTGLLAKGQITVNHLDFMILDDGDKKAFAFDRLLLPFEASYADATLKIPSFQVNGPNFTLSVRSALDLTNRSNPHLRVELRSEAMPVETFQRIFPSSLLPQWVDARLFPIFSGGQVRVDRFSLDGGIRQIADLDLPKSAGALRLRLFCSDLVAFKDGGGIPVEGVSGTLEIVNGGVRATGIKGQFRNSRIEEGSLTVASLYDDVPTIRVAAAGSMDIVDLLQQKELPLIPDEVRQHLQGFSSTTGKIDGSIEIGHEKNWAYPKVLQGKLSFRECAVASTAGVVFPVFIEKGTLTIDGAKRRQFSVTGRWGRTEMDASGNIGESWETGDANIVAQADLVEILAHFQPDLHSSIYFRKPAPCRLTVVKEDKDWRFDGDLDLKDISLETGSMMVEPFEIDGKLGFSGTLEPARRLRISNLTCTAGESSFALSGAYDLQKMGRFDLSVSTEKLRLQDLGVHFKKGNLKGKGSLAFHAAIKGARSLPQMATVTGEARASDLSFAARGFPHPVEQCNFVLRFKEKDLAIESLDLKLGETPLHIKGQLQGWDGIRGDLSIHSDFLDFSSLISPELIDYFKQRPEEGQKDRVSGQGPTPHAWRESADRFIRQSDIHLDITASHGKWQGFPCGPLTMECALQSGDLYLSRSSAEWEHGNLILRGHIQRGITPEMLFSGYIDMTRQPLRELPHSLNFIASRADGLLTLEALLFAKGATLDSLRSELTGSVNIQVDQGVLKKSNMFIKILDFLSLQRMFEARPADLSKNGIYFDSISAHIDLAKGIARSEDGVMRSPVFNAVMMGEADLRTGRLNAEVGIQPLGTIDFLISKVPVAGYLLTGDQKSLYVEYFKVNGPFSDPEVQYIPLKSLGNGTTGFLTRLFLTPKRIYDSFSDAARDFEGNGYPLPDEHLDPKSDVGG